MLPKPKRGQKPEDQAREIEGVLDWMRSNEVGPDETTLSSFLTADQDGTGRYDDDDPDASRTAQRKLRAPWTG